ncbi:hypothetical protein FB45DRAFT_69587 [Roridomyces roridus]|uniref:Uncharacterized protein n=1 Tax=Roridomyces roridus TaxID=1738132 RepID=A0AAD7BMQ5_9AGAR|nr:hypothetical protein FB45DRAFT_69587 [Roridomyces roridus]
MFASAPSVEPSLQRAAPLHSSSLSYPAGFVDPEPLTLRRSHSLDLMRKPLCSSPLAGPATNEGADAAASSPISISPSPSVSSLVPSEAPELPVYEKPSQRPGTLGKRPSRTAPPPIPLPSPPSHADTQLPQLIHTPLPPPPPSPGFHTRKRSRGASISMTNLSASFPLPPPSFPRALTAPSTSRRSATHPLPSSSSDQLLADSTPRFSRLALAAPDIVLPVSARETRRQSVLRGEGGMRVSLLSPPEAATASAPPRSSSLIHTNPLYAFSASTPSLVTLSRSASQSSDSEGPMTPNSDYLGHSVSLEDDMDDVDSVDIALVSPRDFEIMSQDAESEDAHGRAFTRPRQSVQSVFQGVHQVPATSRSMWNLSLRSKTAKRHRRSPAAQPEIKGGTSFFFFGSGDSAMTASTAMSGSSPPSRPHSPAPSYHTFAAPTIRVRASSGLNIAVSAAAVERPPLSPYRAALEAYDPHLEVDSITGMSITPSTTASANGGGSTNSKKSGMQTMRRFLRTISGRR